MAGLQELSQDLLRVITMSRSGMQPILVVL